MLSFHKTVQVRSNLIEINDDDTRAVLIQRLPENNQFGVGTSLGGAVQAGMQVLTTSGPEHLRLTGGEILILTDGIETVAPFVADVIDSVAESGISVHAISLGVDAIAGVEMISSETGTAYYSR